jgi:purine-nucleoside/S-methyl-5'-thioadenosine phosphorylase / adenosine deaminase
VIDAVLKGVPVLRFRHLAGVEGVHHAIFTRHGGVSCGPFHSLNTAFGVGDDTAAVKENRRILSQCLVGAETVFLNQVHGTHVLAVEAGRSVALDGDGAEPHPWEGDALVTALPGKGLAIQTADCQSVLLCDPVRRVVGNVHSGWRGSIANIISRTVGVMVDTFGCRGDRILAGIGPSLGPCCAEFIHFRKEIPENLWHYGDRHHRFDFWSLSRDQLVAAGLAESNIETGRYCTRCRTDLFFSYRGEKRTGRFAAVIALDGDGP